MTRLQESSPVSSASWFMVLLVIAVLGSLDCVECQGQQWAIEVIDWSRRFWAMGDRSLRIDQSGNMSLAYGGSGLFYARREGLRWTYETVDGSPGAGAFGSLVLDDESLPHISYYDQIFGLIKYARRDSVGWHLQTVDSVGSYAQGTSIAIDGSGTPHVCYGAGYPSGVLKYARGDPTGWFVCVIGRGEYPSLALDSAGCPCVSYSGGSSGFSALRFAQLDSSGWSSHAADSSCGTGVRSSLAIDRLGCPHISYGWTDRYGGVKNLCYAYRDTVGWHIECVDAGGEVGGYSSLALDSLGMPSIGYFALNEAKYGWGMADGRLQVTPIGDTHENLKYAQRSASGWRCETIESDGRSGRYCSLAFDPEWRPCVSYFRDDGGRLRLAQLNETGWHSETVDSDGWIGGQVGIQVDATTGSPHLCFYGNYGLTYANQDSVGWQIEPLRPRERSGSRSWLALDPRGSPGILFVVAGDSLFELHFAWKTGSEWNQERIDYQGELGEWEIGPSAALAVDSLGYPHVAYNDPDRIALKYAHRDSSGWHAEPVGLEGHVGESMSIAVTTPSAVHIAYFCGNELKYARRDFGGWSHESVDTLHHWESRTVRLALGTTGLPHMLYETKGAIVLASKDGLVWNRACVDSSWHSSESVGFALDSTDRPHLVFADAQRQSLVYASRGPSGWRTMTVGPSEGVGYGSVAIDVDAQGCPQIAFAGRIGNRSYLSYARLVAQPVQGMEP